MKALSWKEPFATLMLHGKIETRTWDTKYRGEVLICASRKAYSQNQIISISGEHHFNRMFQVMNIARIKSGYAIAVGKLVDSRPMKPEDEDKCFVEYYDDLWCHVYENVRPIKPIPWKGKLGFSNVHQDVIDKIEYL